MAPRSAPSSFSRRSTILGLGLASVPLGAAAQTPVAEPSVDRRHEDWAELGRYHAENVSDLARPAAQRRVVFIGDSITRNWFDKRPGFFTGAGYLGRGISGQTTPQMLVRFMSDVVALKPRVVHILGGTNDVAGNTGPYDPEATKGWLSAMAEIARSYAIDVVLGAVPPTAGFPWSPGAEPAVKIPALNSWLRIYAARESFGFADYTAVLDDGQGGMKPGFAADGVHPTDLGYAAMEPVALAAIGKALKRAPLFY